jgi:hypothetical protein
VTKEPLPDHELRWARAMKAVREDNGHLDEIALQFKAKFHSLPVLDQFFIAAVTDSEGHLRFGVTVFFVKDADIADAEADGTSRAMRDFVYDRLVELGRGNRDELDVEFEFDSFENVQKNFEGSYFLRMR